MAECHFLERRFPEWYFSWKDLFPRNISYAAECTLFILKVVLHSYTTLQTFGKNC